MPLPSRSPSRRARRAVATAATTTVLLSLAVLGLSVRPSAAFKLRETLPLATTLLAPDPAAQPNLLSRVDVPDNYTGDFCEVDQHCVPPRTCFTIANNSVNQCQPSSTGCRCFVNGVLNPCEVQADCEPGDLCALSVRRNANVCVSCKVVATSDTFQYLDDDRTNCDAVATGPPPLPTPSLSPSPAPMFLGVDKDPCTSDDECRDDRTCYTLNTETNRLVPCSPDAAFCLCAAGQLKDCQGAADCRADETCASAGFVPQCASCVLESIDDVLVAVDQRENCGDSSPPSPPPALPSAIVSPTISPPPLQGLTYDPCLSDDNCRSPRVCIQILEVRDCRPDDDICLCIPIDDTSCVSNSDCVPGEVCAVINEPEGLLSCASCRTAILTPLRIVDPDLSNCKENMPGPLSPSTEASLTPEPSSPPDPPVQPTRPVPSATAIVSQPGSPDGSPPGGNGDATASPESDASTTAEVSPSVAATTTEASPSVAATTPTTETPEPPCIAVRHLRHLDAHELVFARAVPANVLCDATGSCATPPHVVVYHGRAMTMARYCARVAGDSGEACVVRRELVNSPRMRWGRRVGSQTHGMEFTPLAARFGTWLEEAVLTAAVHVLGA